MVKLQEKVDKTLREKFGHVLKRIKARYELVDPTPIAPPIGFKRTPSLAEQIRDMVRSEALRAEVEKAGAETFEEADDFDVDDDFDPTSPYEADFDVPVAELRRRQQEDLEKLQAGGDPLPASDAVPSRPAPKTKPAAPPPPAPSAPLHDPDDELHGGGSPG